MPLLPFIFHHYHYFHSLAIIHHYFHIIIKLHLPLIYTTITRLYHTAITIHHVTRYFLRSLSILPLYFTSRIYYLLLPLFFMPLLLLFTLWHVARTIIMITDISRLFTIIRHYFAAVFAMTRLILHFRHIFQPAAIIVWYSPLLFRWLSPLPCFLSSPFITNYRHIFW